MCGSFLFHSHRFIAVKLGFDCNIRIKQFFFRCFSVLQVIKQQERRPVALLECLLIEHETQAVRPEQFHIHRVEVECNDLDLALSAFFLYGCARTDLSVGRNVNASQVRICTQCVLRNLVGIVVPVETRLKL